MLYLHETIDIIGDGQQAYLDSVIQRAQHSTAEGISRLLGTWRVIGSTHRWPRVVNLWEMDGWQHWAATLERQFLPEKQDAALAPWWSRTAQWRSGGFDRILEPAEFCPTRANLVASGLRSWVCVQTVTRTQPGGVEEYFQAFREILAPALRAQGLALMGAYSAPMRSDEVVTLWAAPEFRHLCSVYEQRGTDPELQRWQKELLRLRREAESLWLVPAAQCFFAP